ncbi:MAG: M60 family metallopeptidase [Bacteroidales bacterium]
MYKQLSVALMILFTCIGISCSDEKVESAVLEVTANTINIKQAGEKKSIQVVSNIADVKYQHSNNGASWCNTSLKPVDKGYTLEIDVPVNENKEARSTELKLYGGGLEKIITVNQLGIDPAIVLSSNVFNSEYKTDTLEIELLSNCEYDIIIDSEWIQEIKTKTKNQGMEEFKHQFIITKNSGEGIRSGTIKFKHAGGKAEAIALVMQKGQGVYEGGDVSSIPGDLKIKIEKGTTSSFQPGGEIEKSFDGDKGTIYHSSWDNSAPNYFPITIEYELEETPSMDYLIYYPRTSGGNGNFKQVEIWATTKENSTYQKVKDYDFEGVGTASKVYFDQQVINPVKVKFIVRSGAGDRQGFATCAEMEFYRKNPESFDPSTVFEDELCSALKPSITQKEVDAIANPFFRNMAQYMLDGKYDTKFRIASFKPYRHPDYMAAINKTSPYSLLDNPTGMFFKTNEEIVVFVGETNGGKLSLQVQDLAQGYGGQNYPLSQGMNKLRISQGGLGYIKYFDNDKSRPAIQVHFATGKVQGYYDPLKHTPQECADMLYKAEHPYFDVLGTYAHLTYPVNRFKASPNIKELIEAYDDIVLTQQKFMGLLKYDKQFDNRMYFHVVYGDAHMYATSYRTAYHDNTLSALCSAGNLKGGNIWGPAHEVGHCNQTRPGLKWAGTTEVTNNIHSLVCQTYFGNETRLQSEDIGGVHGNRYQAGFTNIIANKQPHNSEGDVFCKLIPFWQLQLYSVHVKKYTDLYADLHERVRMNPNLSSDGANMMQFVKWTCDAMQEDLTEFFTDWGFLRPCDFEIDDYGKTRFIVTEEMIKDAKDYIASKNYPKPSRKLQYMHDEAINDFVSNASLTAGSYTLSGNNVSISGSSGVSVFEVYSGSVLKMVTHRKQFALLQAYENLEIRAISVQGNSQVVTRK